MEFNKLVHETNDHGDPIRKTDGGFALKSTWKQAARDHMGRAFNPKLHGESPELDDKGQLKMVRRDPGRKPMATSNKTKEFTDRFRKENDGYAYRVVNDEGGRLDQFKKHDWEPVMDGQGVATIKVGQARQPGTSAILMRKPQEWYDEDQQKKDEILNANLDANTKPKEGQYGEGMKQSRSPLR